MKLNLMGPLSSVLVANMNILFIYNVYCFKGTSDSD